MLPADPLLNVWIRRARELLRPVVVVLQLCKVPPQIIVDVQRELCIDILGRLAGDWTPQLVQLARQDDGKPLTKFGRHLSNVIGNLCIAHLLKTGKPVEEIPFSQKSGHFQLQIERTRPLNSRPLDTRKLLDVEYEIVHIDFAASILHFPHKHDESVRYFFMMYLQAGPL